MKKILSILLVILLAGSVFLALPACSAEREEHDTPDDQPDTLERDRDAEEDTGAEGVDLETLRASKPNEYVKEKLEAGMEVQVAFVPIEFGSSTFILMDKGLKEGFEDMGVTYMSSAYEMDTARHIELVENYITMGCAMIITICLDDSLADIAARAIDAGTYFCIRKSLVSYDVSFNASSDPYVFGGKIGDMIIAWADYKYPDAGAGEVKVASVLNEVAQVFIVELQGVMDRLAEDERIDVCFTSSEVNLTTETGFTFAENARMYDPEIKTFLALSFNQAIGMNNYIASVAGDDFADYAVFAADVDTGATETVDSQDNCVRGFASEGGEYPYEFIFANCVKLLLGEIEPGLTIVEPAVLHTDFGFEIDER